MLVSPKEHLFNCNACDAGCKVWKRKDFTDSSRCRNRIPPEPFKLPILFHLLSYPEKTYGMSQVLKIFNLRIEERNDETGFTLVVKK